MRNLCNYIGLLLFLFGCSVPRQYSPAIPAQSIDSRQPTDWVINHDDALRNAQSVFSVTTEYSAKSVNELMIKGHILSCRYSYIPEQIRQIPVQYYDRNHNSWVQTWKQETQRLATYTKDWKPINIQVQNPFGETIIAEVDEYGDFKATVSIPTQYFLTHLPNKAYLTATKCDKQFIIKISAVAPPYGGTFELQKELPVFWQYTIDTNKAKEFANQRITDVLLKFRDKNSRKSIMPKVTVTALKPTKNAVYAFFSKEFMGNEKLIDTAFDSIYGTVFCEASKTTITDCMNFKAWVEGEYKIEVTHADYYYFSSILEPKVNDVIKKDILLIEKGNKVRIEKTDEGEVGSMIDSD